MTIHIVETGKCFQELEHRWECLHTQARGTVFQTFLWNLEWWKCYAQGNYRLRIVCVMHDDMLVGILPMFHETVNMGLFKFTRLRFLGIYETYGEYKPLIHPEYEKDVATAMATFCANDILNKQCDMISFFRFPPTSGFMEQFLAAIASKGLHVRYTANCVTRVMMNLPADWETYLNMLSHNEKRMLKRRMRKLMGHGVELEILKSSHNDVKDFDDFVRLHTATWADKGIRGYFVSPRFTTFQRDITSQLREKNIARLYFFKKDGVRFAAVQAFFINDQCCFYLSGLDRCHELIHYSPGKVLLSMVINDAIKEGYKIFDFQGGKEEYKFRLGGKATTFSKALVWKTGTASPKVYAFLISQSLWRFVLDTLWKDTVLTSMRKVVHHIRQLQQKLLAINMIAM